MAQYTSQPARLPQTAHDVIARFDDLSRLQDLAAQLPSEKLAAIGDVKFSQDAITIDTPQLGSITLTVVERTDDRVVLEPTSTPVPLKIVIKATPATPESCDLTTTVDVDIPPMLKPFIGGKMQQVADKMGEMMANLASIRS